jgi:hypothetical protein
MRSACLCGLLARVSVVLAINVVGASSGTSVAVADVPESRWTAFAGEDTAGVVVPGHSTSGVSTAVPLYLWGAYSAQSGALTGLRATPSFVLSSVVALPQAQAAKVFGFRTEPFPLRSETRGLLSGWTAPAAAQGVPVFLASGFSLASLPNTRKASGAAFAVALIDSSALQRAGRVAISGGAAFPVFLAPGFMREGVGRAVVFSGQAFEVALSRSVLAGGSASSATPVFGVLAMERSTQAVYASTVRRDATPLSLSTTAPFLVHAGNGSASAASQAFSGYLAAGFDSRLMGHTHKLNGALFELRLSSGLTGGTIALLSPPFPLSLNSGQVAVAVSFIHAEFVGGGAQVQWRLVDGEDEYVVERAVAAGEWRPLGTKAINERGEIAVEDRDVASGQRYGYRLMGREEWRGGLGEVWVEVPLFQLGMTGATPNPARLGQLMVSFVLPDREPARLEVLDVAGRIVASHDVGALGPGAHVFDASRGVRFSPGVYFLRLVRAERALVKKATLTR